VVLASVTGASYLLTLLTGNRMYFSFDQCSDLAGHPGTGDDWGTTRGDELHLLIGDV
jgi:hypothetical protein